MVWSGPAFGLAVTFIKTVSLQPFCDQYKVYVPAEVKPETLVVGDVVLTKDTTAGFDTAVVHVPVPVAVIAVVEYWQMVWSVPAFGFAVTFIRTVSLQPLSDQYKVYVPAAVKPETDVVGDVVLAKVTTVGFEAAVVHVPVPIAAIAVVEYWQMVWSGPAFGLAVTFIRTVSLHPLSDQYKVYVPAALKPETEVVGDMLLTKNTAAGFNAALVHVPIPDAVIAMVVY